MMRAGHPLVLVAAWVAGMSLCACADEHGPALAAVDDSESAVAGPRIFVDDDAPPGGNGTLDAPFTSLAEAFVAARERVPDGGAIIRVAPGRYLAPVEPALPPATQVIGEGSGLTSIVGGSAEVKWQHFGVFTLMDVSVAGSLWIEGETSRILRVHIDGGAQLTLGPGDATVDNLSADGGSLALRRAGSVQVRDGRITRAGINAFDVTDLQLSRFRVEQSEGPAIHLDGSHATLVDVFVEAALTRAVDASMVIVDGGSVRAEGLTVRASRTAGLDARDGAEVALTGFALNGGVPAVLLSHATAALVDGSVSGATEGVVAERSVLSAERVAVADHDGNCINFVNGSLTLRDVALTGCRSGGLHAVGTDTVDIVDVSVSKVRGTCVALLGVGGPVTVNDLRLAWCLQVGVELSGQSGTRERTFEMADLDVSNIESRWVSDTFAGIVVRDATARVVDSHIHDFAGAGIDASQSSVVVLRSEFTDLGATGVAVADDEVSTSRVADCRIESVGGAGVFVYNAVADIVGNTILDTVYSPRAGEGEGVAVGGSSFATVAGNTIVGSASNGVLFFDGASGYIEGNQIARSGAFGIREECLGAVESALEVGGNELNSNRRGDTDLCEGSWP